MHAQGVRIALVVAVLATCGWPLVARADTLTFFPTDDTCIAMNGPSQNSCALPAMAVRNRYGYQSADWEWDPLLRFDLSSIPPNATITAATLHLYYFQYSDNNPAGRSLTCYRLLNDWSECAVTWNNQPARAAQTTAVAVVPPTAGRWLEWDVTADVQAFADGSLTNNGWIIMDEQPWSSFNIPITRLQSKEFGQFIPYLRVAIAPKLVASDAAPGDAFGRAVAVNGATALIGASADDNRGPDAGSAYVFRWDGSIWVQEAKLVAADGAAGDHFGFSVAIDGDVAIVGAPHDDVGATDSGSAYVFRRTGQTWVQEARLVPTHMNYDQWFGISVAVQGNVAVIGAHRDDAQGIRAGAVYIFRYDGSNWRQEAKLLPDNGGDIRDWAYFGGAVAIDGNAIAIGADGAYVGDERQGEAYVFRWNGSSWDQEARLLAPDGAFLDNFGYCLDIDRDVIVVGAFWDDDRGTDSGSVYVFRYDGANWRFETKLLAADGAADEEFGISVALSGDNAVIGARFNDERGADCGAAYRFSYDGTGWFQVAKLTPSDAGAGDQFGISVACHGNTVLVGADHHDPAGIPDAGAAYLYVLGAFPPGDMNCDGTVNSRDVNPFVVYLSDFPTWTALSPGCPAVTGDTNGDGTYPSFKDVNSFVELLMGGN